MTRRKPYPRITVSGPAASELLILASRWGMTPEEVVVRLCAEAHAYRTASTVMSVGAAIVGSLLSPTEQSIPVLSPSRRLGP
jgi:hypothetical protein